MSRTLLTLVLVAIAVFLSPSIFGQQNQPLEDGTHLNRSIQQAPGMNAPPVRSEDEATQQMLQNHRKQRQLELIRDAEKLHQLSGELKEFLDKNGSTILSVDMLKKAETVEKLAHSVRTKMKDLQ
jgi:hypothetical protein